MHANSPDSPNEREIFISAQNKILAMIAGGELLSVIMEEIIAALSRYRPEVICSALVMENDEHYLRYLSAPTEESIVGQDDYHVSSVHWDLRNRVIVEELLAGVEAERILIAEMARAQANPASLLRTVSSPTGEFLGFLSLYFGEARLSDAFEQEQLQVAAYLLGIAVHKRLTENRLITAKEEALRASRARSEFLANMSHEIRTPLTAIIGFAENLQLLHLEVEDRQSAVASILRNSDLLLRLLNDILDLSKVDAGKLEIVIERVDLFSVLEDVLSLMSGKAKDKGLSLDLEVEYPFPRYISSDGLRLKQILVNLLGNAIKFTDVGGAKLMVAYVPELHLISFIVRDTGIGMTADVASKVFERFCQGELPNERRFGGTGLGLSIAKSLAELLGGGISCVSEVGKGSEFRVSINPNLRIEELEMCASWPGEELQDAGNLNIRAEVQVPRFSGKALVVEDTPDNQLLLSSLLKSMGCLAIVCVETAEAALERAQIESFDLVLMDLQLPKMDGCEATRILRSRGFNKTIIGMSAISSLRDSGQMLEAGCDLCVNKPFRRKQFYAAIEQVLRNENPERTKAELIKEKTTKAQVATDDQGEVMRLSDTAPVDLVKNSLLKFSEVLAELLDSLAKSVQTGDYADLKKRSHRLSGSAGMYGFDEIGELASQIEEAIDSGKPELCGPIGEDLQKLYADLVSNGLR